MPGDLYYGDNLDVMRRHVASESIDLVYLDPPFNSDRNYNLVHRGSEAQARAFVDTWTWDDAAEESFHQLTDRVPEGVHVPRELSDMMLALRSFLGEHRDTLAYLSMMAIRLVELKRVLRSTGSLYLHCDPTASHYLKLILDAVFGPECFQNEIVWERAAGKNDAKRYGRSHDTVFFYSRGKHFTWNQQHSAFQDYSVAKNYTAADPDGRRYRLSDLTANKPGGDVDYEWHGQRPYKGRHWAYSRENMDKFLAEGRIVFRRTGMPVYKRYLDEMPGVPLQDVWTDIRLPSDTPERIGWKTQKPVALLERILLASSNEGDVVLDPFCGCGTTVEAAETLKRKWIGIDVAIRAVDIIKDRLDEKFQPPVWKEHGEPADVEQAARLAEANAYDFQWWAVRLLGGRPPKGEKKKGGDGGIDGELTLTDRKGVRRRGILSVKAGHTLTPDFVRALSETVRQETADFGVLVTMHEPTKGMRDVARDCGPATWAAEEGGKLAHRIRIVTAPEIMAGQVQWPGKLERPRSQSVPPPPEARAGETLNLPFAPRVPKARRSKPGTAKAKPYETPPAEVRAVAERGSQPPPSKSGRGN